MNLRLVIPSVLVLAVGGGLFLLSTRSTPARVVVAPPPPPPPDPHRHGAPAGPYKAEPVRVETLPRTESLPATVEAPPEVIVTCSLRSPFVEVPIHEGSAVKKGDLLARVNREPYEKALAAARKAGDAVKEAEMRRALEEVELRAPADGVVFHLEARLGEMPPRDSRGPRPAVTLLDWTAILFRATAAGETATLVRGGAQVFVRVPGSRLIAAAAKPAGEAGPDGAVALEVRPVEAPDAAPQPGAAGEVLLVTGTRDGLVVPIAAVLEEQGQTVVYVKTSGGDLVRTPVVAVQAVGGGRVEVTGLGRFDAVAVWEGRK